MEEWKGLLYFTGKDTNNENNDFIPELLDFSKYYEVSNTGKIRNYKTKIEVKLTLNKHGYLQYCCSLGSRSSKKILKVHRAVISTFAEKQKDKHCINHINLEKTNNNIYNLEWCTISENNIHAIKSGAVDLMSRRGQNNVNSKLTNDDVLFIRNNYIPRHKEFGARSLARKFNVHHKRIYNIINNISYVNS